MDGSGNGERFSLLEKEWKGSLSPFFPVFHPLLFQPSV